MGEKLRHAVRAARVEGRRLSLRSFCDLAEHLGAAGLVEADRPVGTADCLDQAQVAHAGGVRGELRHLEADLDVALSAQVVDLVGSQMIEGVDQ